MVTLPDNISALSDSEKFELLDALWDQTVTLPAIWSDEAIAEFYDAEQWYAGVSLRLSQRFTGSGVKVFEENNFCITPLFSCENSQHP